MHFEPRIEKKITIVLSFPGACEELQGRPVAGKSGENLEIILNELQALSKSDDWQREKSTITNAWDKVDHVCKTGRSEADLSEIKSESNIKRII